MRSTLLLLPIVLFFTSHSWAFDLIESAKKLTQPTSASTVNNTATNVASSGLTSLLTSGLNVSTDQANGGLGSLFSLAKNTLGDTDFNTLSKSVPDMSSYLDAAPALSSSGGGLMSSLGGLGESANAVTSVASQFSSLGLSAEHIPQYIQVINDYLQSSGGQQAAELFQSGIANLL